MSGTMDQTGNGPWLVKSGERILGPFSTDALSQLLREKEIVVIDEVMAAEGRWTYLRDVPAFEAVVEEIRTHLAQSAESTEVQAYTSTTSVTGTKTEPALRGPVLVHSVPATKPAPVEKFVEPVKSVMTPRDRSIESSQPQYARPRPPSKIGVVIGAVVLIAVLTFIIYTVSKQPKTAVTKTADATSDSPTPLQTQASLAWKRGEFDRALELYRKIDQAQPAQPLIAARLAILMMKLEGQTVEAKRVIESARPNATEPEQQSELAIASGLAALQSDDVKEAATKFASAGSSWIAAFDEGVANLNLKNWAGAVGSFEKAGAQSVSYLMTARAHLAADEAGGVGHLVPAAVAIKKALAASPDYQQEALVVGSYIDLKMGQKKLAAAKVLEAIETDPNQTNDHFHDPSLSLENVSWAKLVPMCRAIHAELSTKNSAALVGICLAKASQLEEASKLIEQEVSKDSSNSSLQAANAFLQLQSGREEASRASLTIAMKRGSSRLAQILSARLCAREGQEECAEEGWSKLASEARPPIAALTGLAQVRRAKGDLDAANALMVKADALSPSYLPLLRMREEASR